MKKLLAIILSFLCITVLFNGCSDGKKNNLLGCGFEFGMTKDEVNEIGREVTKNDAFDVDVSYSKDGIDRDRIIKGTSEDLMPYKTNYYFDDENKLYCIDFWIPMVNENDAEIILNNIISIYGKFEDYEETNDETDLGRFSAFTYEDKNIKVYITYDYSELMDNGTLMFYLVAPDHMVPQK